MVIRKQSCKQTPFIWRGNKRNTKRHHLLTTKRAVSLQSHRLNNLWLHLGERRLYFQHEYAEKWEMGLLMTFRGTFPDALTSLNKAFFKKKKKKVRNLSCFSEGRIRVTACCGFRTGGKGMGRAICPSATLIYIPCTVMKLPETSWKKTLLGQNVCFGTADKLTYLKRDMGQDILHIRQLNRTRQCSCYLYTRNQLRGP